MKSEIKDINIMRGRNLYPIITIMQLLSPVINYSDYHKVISSTQTVLNYYLYNIS